MAQTTGLTAAWLMGRVEQLDRERHDLREENGALRRELRVSRWLMLALGVLLFLAGEERASDGLSIVHILLATLGGRG